VNPRLAPGRCVPAASEGTRVRVQAVEAGR